MHDLSPILKGVNQEAERYTLDATPNRIQLPKQLNDWRQRLSFEYDFTSFAVDSKMLFDRGTTEAGSGTAARISQHGLYLVDRNRREPEEANVPLRLCRIQFDRFGQLTKITLTVPKEEFTRYVQELAQHSSFFAEIGKIKIPESFPSGRPYTEYFSSLATVLHEEGDANLARLAKRK